VTSVLLADDQELVRAGFRLILELAGLTVAGEAADGHEAVELARALRPDVALMDVRMPRMDGIEATRRIGLAALPTRVLVLTTFDLDEHVYDPSAPAPAASCSRTSTVTSSSRRCARWRAANRCSRPASCADWSTTTWSTRRPSWPGRRRSTSCPSELEVLRLVGSGRSNAEIAAELVISVATVKTHVRHVLAKLGLRDRVQAVVFAYEAGVIRAGA
jgi:DNA-binding NarL/FixJ family response regulator